MALSHSKVKKQSEIHIDRKEDDPNRINMTKAEAVAANELLRKDKKELISFQEEQRRKREEEMEKITGKKIKQKHDDKESGEYAKAHQPAVSDVEDDEEDEQPEAEKATGLQHGKLKGKKGK